MSAELEPCPFCGTSNARLLPPTCRPETPYNAADRLYPVVSCLTCGAVASGRDEDYKGASAVAAWNRRVVSAERERALEAVFRIAEAIEEAPTYRDYSGTDESTCAWCSAPLEGYEGRQRGAHGIGCRWLAARAAVRELLAALREAPREPTGPAIQGWQTMESAEQKEEPDAEGA